jgi:hypothetical protein
MNCDALRAIENNLDWCHPYFVHPWIHGKFFATHFQGFRNEAYELRTTNKGLVVFTPPTKFDSDPLPEHPIVKLEFELPAMVRVEFWKPFHQIIIMNFVSMGPGRCRLEWLTTKLWRIGRHVTWHTKEPKIIAQDRVLLESAQPWYDRCGEKFEHHVVADASTLMARKIVKLAAEGRWESQRFSLPKRRIIEVRA